MAESVPPVSLSVGDILSLKSAAQLANVSESTVVRWARLHGIGRQLGAGSPWRISGPALRMVAACDTEALKAFRARDYEAPSVSPYMLSRSKAA